MTIPNPIPYALSHLAQRDRAVRERALEEAALVAENQPSLGIRNSDGTWRRDATSRDKCAAAIRALKEMPA